MGEWPGRDRWSESYCLAFVWEGAALWGASSAVLKVMVTRSEATVLECARFIERQLNNYFCGKMLCSNY